MPIRQRLRGILTTLGLLVALAGGGQASAQIINQCLPIKDRTGEIGCWIITDEALGQLSDRPMFWHLDAYPTRADAAKGPRGTVLEGLGKIWVSTIGEAGSRPSIGERIAEIGPLPVSSGEQYSASTWKPSSLQE